MIISASLFDRLQHQHEIMFRALDGFTIDELKTRVIPDKWSAFEQLVHLTAYQPLFMKRIGLIMNNEQPAFGAYRADDDPVFREYLDKSLPELKTIFLADRGVIASQLEKATEQQNSYWGEHARFGRLTLADWAEFFLLHEAHHQFNIFMLTRLLRKSLPR